ncbi:sulfatase [Halomontanus rarus]|uniref:sulfatase n=1 Tax=Halomontanus rarus TaxID=3034020 RepID=UPI002FF62034
MFIMNCIVILCDTLRRDHCGPYHQGRPLSAVQSDDQPDWVVPTPNMDRLAERGTVFENAYNGSTPCAPARRDLYTGRYDFLERAWGPLEPTDEDLPRQVSGPPNESIAKLEREGYKVSELISDHYHLWEEGMGNYHTGYTGFEFIRGQESDAWKTDPIEFETPDGEDSKLERHFRNVALTREGEEDHFAAQVFQEAADWIDHNHEHEDFYLHIDCFDPHEPWDPPEELLKQFDPRGYDVEDWDSLPAYDEWANHYDEDDLRHIQARYAAMVVLVDRWLGQLLDSLDRNDLWEDTMVVFTTDHGTFNGDMGRTGKFHGGTDTHNHEACAHIPFVVAHPEYGQGERREQLVQLVDVYPTILNAVGRPVPENRHGMDLTSVLQDPKAELRDYAISGLWGASMTITDGEWVLHQAPVEGNEPLYWYGITGETDDALGPYDAEEGRRKANKPYPLGKETWLSDKREDPNELENLADERPDKLREMQRALRRTLEELDAPPEQVDRLGIADT